MDKQTAEKATGLLKEIEDISKYKDLLNSKNGNVAHMEMVQHYGNLQEYEKVVFHHQYNNLFIPIIDRILNDLKEKLDKL